MIDRLACTVFVHSFFNCLMTTLRGPSAVSCEPAKKTNMPSLLNWLTALKALSIVILSSGLATAQSLDSVTFKQDTFTNCDSNKLLIHGIFPNTAYSVDSILRSSKQPLQYQTFVSASGIGLPAFTAFTDSVKTAPVTSKTDTIVVTIINNGQTTDSIVKPVTFKLCGAKAGFKLSHDSVCQGEPFNVMDKSLGADSIAWYLNGRFQASGNVNFSLNKPGQATLEQVVFDTADGTSDTAKAVVYAYASPNVAITPDSICGNQPDTLQASARFTNYAWSRNGNSLPNNSSKLLIERNGIYAVEITDSNGCKASDTSSVKARVDLGPDTSLCEGDTFLLDATVPDGQLYRWQDGSSQPTLNTDSAGKYTVKVTDTNGCIGRDTIQRLAFKSSGVTIPDTFFCEGDSVTLDAGQAAHYQWQNGDTTRTTTIKKPGMRLVTVQNSKGCQAIDSAMVTEQKWPAVNLRPDTAICKNDTVILNAGPNGDDYQWSTGAKTQQIKVNQKGLYTVSVSKQTCSATDSFRLKVNQSITFSLGSDTVLCPSDSLRLSGPEGAKAYQWSDGRAVSDTLLIGDSLKQFPNPQTLALTVTDTNGCQSSDSVLVTRARKPDFTLNPVDTVICEGKSIVLQALANTRSYTYTWSDGSTGNTFRLDTAAIGTFTIDVTVENVQGCQASDTAKVMVEGCSGIPAHQADNLNIYPNPATGQQTRVEWDTDRPIQEVRVQSLGGREVYRNQNPQPALMLPSDQWQGGLYTVIITTGQKQFYQKLVVQ